MELSALTQLSQALADVRPAALLAERERTSSLLSPLQEIDLFVESIGFKGIGQHWHEINREKAFLLLAEVIGYNLAYRSSREVDEQQAEELAKQFLGHFCEEARSFTNGLANDGGWSGHRVAPGTFETGVVCISNQRVGMLWVQDED